MTGYVEHIRHRWTNNGILVREGFPQQLLAYEHVTFLLAEVDRLSAQVARVWEVCSDPGGPDSWSHTFQGRASVFVDDIIYALYSEEFL